MKSQRELVVLVHGLWMNRYVMAYLARQIRRAGYDAVAFSYPSALQPFEKNVAALATFVRARSSARIHFVAHSLGGVLILSALPRLSDLDLGRAVLLGAPIGGSVGATQFMHHAFGRFCVGATQKLWQSFPALSCAGQQEIGVIAGTRRIGLGRFFTALPGLNDGVVCVEETRIAGLADHIVLPVSHTGMLFARAIAEQTERFLRTGSFTR